MLLSRRYLALGTRYEVLVQEVVLVLAVGLLADQSAQAIYNRSASCRAGGGGVSDSLALL